MHLIGRLSEYMDFDERVAHLNATLIESHTVAVVAASSDHSQRFVAIVSFRKCNANRNKNDTA